MFTYLVKVRQEKTIVLGTSTCDIYGLLVLVQIESWGDAIAKRVLGFMV